MRTRRRVRRLHASASLGRVSIQFRGVGVLCLHVRVASATLPRLPSAETARATRAVDSTDNARRRRKHTRKSVIACWAI